MKNASKRLFSLMLAVVLLVSVVPFQALAAEDETTEAETVEMTELTETVEAVEAQATVHTVAVYDSTGEWRMNVEVEDGGVVPADLLAKHFDMEGYNTNWERDGERFVPGVTKVYSNIGIGCSYEKLVTKYSVEFYVGEKWVAGIKVGTDGKILDGTVPTAPEVEGSEFVGWFHSAGEYKPGKTVITGDLVVGAKYEVTDEDDKDDNNNRPGKGDREVLVTVYIDGKKVDSKILSVDKNDRPGNDWLKRIIKNFDEDDYSEIDWDRKDDNKYTVELTTKRGGHDGDHRPGKDEKKITITYKINDNKPVTKELTVDEDEDYKRNGNDWLKQIIKGFDKDDYREIDWDKKGDNKYYVELSTKRNEHNSRELEMTVYVNGKKVVDEKEIKVYEGETFKEDGDDWLRRAMGDKYNRYDYKVEKYDFKDHDTELYVWLTDRHGHNDKNEPEVYLDIYINGDKRKPAKTVKITNGAAANGSVTMDEAISIVKDYYTAKTSQGIDFTGLWMEKDKFDKHEAESKIDVRDYRGKRDVTIVIMADNVKAKSTSNNNSSNPKTGDEIMMSVTVMTISAAALACAYFFNKKRMAK